MLQKANINAVAAIRVSTTKQGTDGDSPEAQREQIERFAEGRGIKIKQYFVFLESASKEQQPIQQAIDYCKDPKNGVNLFIIKSIDRFTRGGSDTYNPLKLQLEQAGVSLVDIYGVISDQKVNTLDHLGFEYNWSVYSPTKKSEILEAERSKDELRDILSRVIGAEIRYTNLGYWMRQAPYGYRNEKVDTQHGKRTILVRHPEEAPHIEKIFQLRAEGYLSDQQIVDKLNDRGFKTRIRYVRDKHDRSKVIKQTGGQPLTVKALQKLILNPLYAGIICEKWTDNKPIKGAFDGLVSIAMFNKANQGKKTIEANDQGDYTITKAAPPKNVLVRGKKTINFPYRRFVLCPECEKPLLGSASRGRNGKYYPAYHCSNHGHYFRVSKDELEDQVAEYVKQFIVPRERVADVMSLVRELYEKHREAAMEELQSIDERIAALQTESEMVINKLKVLSNQTALQYLEQDLERIEKQVAALEARKEGQNGQKDEKIEQMLTRVQYFLENLDELLIKQRSQVKKSLFFRALFKELPTYEQIKTGNTKTPLSTGVNSLIALLPAEKSLMVIPTGVEPVFSG
jgi:site-specific DNA recombinase